MAVINNYVSSNRQNDTYGNNYADGGIAETGRIVTTFEVAAGDDDGSIYRLATLPGNAMINKVTVMCDAITGGTDYDLGLYKVLDEGGAVLDKDVFMDGQTLASASRVLDGLQTVAIENLTKRVYEHAGHTVSTQLAAYDLALTGNTVGTAAGTVTVIVDLTLA